jgi:glycosyltransferase involved in cell wall biosynthesis
LSVLFLACHLPWPPVSGGRRREWELIRRLADRGVAIDLVAVSKTPDEDQRNAPRLRDHCRSVTVVPAEPGAPDHLAGQVRRHHAPPARDHVGARIAAGHVDLVHVESFYLHHLLPEPCPVPVVLTDQNVEFDLWAQRARLTRDPAERRELSAEAARTREAELAAWAAADRCVAVTADDARRMRSVVPDLTVDVVPDGIDRFVTSAGPPAGPPSAVFVANFAYQPNVDAALHLLRDVTPRVAAMVPEARWSLVGNQPPDEVLAAAAAQPQVEVTGRVPSVAPYLDRAHVVACPLRVGGGVKVKVLEALSHGKAVVTTSIGAQGLEEASDALVIADDAEAFARATARLLVSPSARRRAERRARVAATRLPTWDAAADALAGIWAEILVAEPPAVDLGERRATV